MRAMLPADDQPNGMEAQTVIRQICDEASRAADKRCEDFWINLGKPGAPNHNSWTPKLDDSGRWSALKADDASLQVAVAMAVFNRHQWEQPRGLDELWVKILAELVRRKLPFQAEHLHELLERWFEQPDLEHGFGSLPGLSILGAVERYARDRTLDIHISDILARLRARAFEGRLGQPPNKFHRDVVDRIDKLLDPAKKLPEGQFAADFAEWLSTLETADREKWLALAHVAVEAGDKATPSSNWLSQAKAASAPIPPIDLAKRIARWLEETIPDPTRPDNSLDILKGSLWLSTLIDHSLLVGKIGQFAEKCFRKVPRIGIRSAKLGNAALWALSEMADEPQAVAELFRLREKIKHISSRKIIESYLDEVARKRGQTVAAMEDFALPHFGLDANSVSYFQFGEARAELEVHADKIAHRWFNGAGKSVKSIPAEVRATYGTELAAFKQVANDLEHARAAQILRLEQSWTEERRWTFAAWKDHFLEHPLRRPIVETLIWWVGDQVVIPDGQSLKDVEGRDHSPSQDAGIRLWHPLDSSPDQVLAWRRRIVELGLTQPIKQAHREIYVLTDAERQTRTYSNRFAAHILRQHQFRALCQARGWKYDLMGGWDGWNIPTRQLPAQGLQVEYHVDVVEDGQRTDSWVAFHLASDQVRFLDGRRQPVALEGLSSILFSEVMRDVDLFVAVTSVANDPAWTDGGPGGRHGGYWREWAFGDLGQSAATRKELISSIAPRLTIADKLEITDKFLIVQGKLQKYAIHFGSGNIQILPGNRYLCIVADRPPAETANLKLPFAGDSLLSMILAKAFLLVDEHKIRDETILRQL